MRRTISSNIRFDIAVAFYCLLCILSTPVFVVAEEGQDEQTETEIRNDVWYVENDVACDSLDTYAVGSVSIDIKATDPNIDISGLDPMWRIADSDWVGSGSYVHYVPPITYKVEFTDLLEFAEPNLSMRVIGNNAENDNLNRAEAFYKPLPRFAIGDIPPQSAIQGQTLEFLIDPNTGNALSAISFDVVGDMNGFVSLEQVAPLSWLCRYTPDANDKESVLITFRRFGDGFAQSNISFTPIPLLPDEYLVFDKTPSKGIPDPESKYYLVVTEEVNDTKESFNWVPRATRTINISGKTVVFEEGHEQGLSSYSNSQDIKQMNIYAETLIIKSPLRLPQTEVNIFAKELRFEDTNSTGNVIEMASICTTPVNCLFSEPNGVTPTDAAEDGENGLKGGNINLNIESLYTQSVCIPRIITSGSPGQKGGNGKHGENRGACDLMVLGCNGFFQCCNFNDGGSCYDSLNVPFGTIGAMLLKPDPNPITLELFDYWPDKGFVTSPSFPSEPTDAKPSGVAGDGGDAGDFRTTLLAPPEVYDVSGGAAGEQGEEYIGGQYFLVATLEYVVSLDEGHTWATQVSKTYENGANAQTPPSSDGKHGGGTLTGESVSWLKPYNLKAILAHAKDAYLRGHLDYTGNILSEYLHLLETAEQLAEYDDLTLDEQHEMQQMKEEIQVILHRIENNLDYYGNPAGWVPMLSFEVNKIAFEQEINHAIRVLYLSYWVGSVAGELQDQLDAMEYAKDLQIEDIENLHEIYSDCITKLPDLKFSAQKVADAFDGIIIRLHKVEQDLMDRAVDNVNERNKKPWWKKAIKVAGTIATLVPYKQPALAAAGQSAVILSESDEDSDQQTCEKFMTLEQNFNGTSGYVDSSEMFDDKVQSTDLSSIKEDGVDLMLQNLQDSAQPMAEDLQRVTEIINKSKAPNSEVQKELDKIRASDPAFKDVMNRIEDLLIERSSFASQLAATMQTISSSSNAIVHDLLSIDGMNVDSQAISTTLNTRSLMYLKEMEQRARRRLQKYHYYMAKAYEYRTLKKYEGELNLQKIFDEFKKISDSRFSLSETAFTSIKGVYEGLLSTVAETIFDEYNSNRSELSVPIRFNLLPEELDIINSGDTLKLNLMDIGLFLPSEENIRIVDISAKEMDVHIEGGDFERFAYLTLYMDHSGDSLLKKDGKVYKFQHYNENTSSPITWGVRYDGWDGTIDAISPSAASESLLYSLLTDDSGNVPSSDKLLIYSRPAGWADILISKDVWAYNNVDMVIDHLRLEVKYDFMRQQEDKVDLEIMTWEPQLKPYLSVDTTDLNAKQDGYGHFYRSYRLNQEVSVTALESYGMYVFKKWTDQYGDDLEDQPATDNSITIKLDDNKTICAEYESAMIYDLYADSIINMMDFAKFGSEWSQMNCGLCNGADFTGDGNVTIEDLQKFAQNWLLP
jgi:hypothetical protein